jgi:hypothetical protein
MQIVNNLVSILLFLKTNLPATYTEYLEAIDDTKNKNAT